MSAITTIATIPSRSAAKSTPSRTAMPIWKSCDDIRMRRRSMRSATAPPTSMNVSSGASCAKLRRPR